VIIASKYSSHGCLPSSFSSWTDRLIEMCSLCFQLILLASAIFKLLTLFDPFRGLHLYVTSNVVHHKERCRGDIPDLYSGGTFFESRVGNRLTCFEDFCRVSQVLQDSTEKHLFWTKATSVLRFPIIYSIVIHLFSVNFRYAVCRKLK
jgi:hypothetical protein